MADFTPIAAQVQPPPSGLGTISSILGIKQQQQALQTGQYTQATAQAESEQADQKNKELQAAQSLALNGAKSGQYTNPDGSLNRQKMADDISKVAPTYGQGIASSMLSQANEVLANQKTHQSMTADQQGIMSNTFQALAGKKDLSNSDITDALDALTDQFQGTPGFKRMALSMATHIPNQASSQQLQALMGQFAAAGRGEPQQAPSTIDTGAQIQPGATNRYSGAFSPSGAPIAKVTPPTVTTNAMGQTVRVAPGGTGVSVVPGQPNANPTQAQATSATGMAGNDTTRYSQISQEGSNATTGAQLADQVSQLADQVRTGKLTKEWADRLAVLKQHDPDVTARQMLSKYAAQLKTMATAGATTDASRSQIDEGMPSPESMDPDAVKQASQYVGGIFRMRGARQAYADQYVKNAGSSMGIQGADDSFMRSADPTVFAYKALPSGAERQEFLKNHGLTTPDKQQQFKARLNQVTHYSGGQ